MKLINFFIDELGSASPKTKQSKIYVLSGIMATNQSREKLKVKANQIKFKYWNKTNIVFHSREIGRKEGDFKKLRDRKTNQTFLKDLVKFLKQGSYQLFGVVVDKQKIPKNWNEKTIYEAPPSLRSGFLLASSDAGSLVLALLSARIIFICELTLSVLR